MHNSKMRSILLMLMAVLSISSCTSSTAEPSTGVKNNQITEQASATKSTQNGEQELLVVFNQYAPALQNKDVATLERIWADDLSFVNPRGQLVTKRERLENLKGGATSFKSIRETDKNFHMYGDTAVVTLKVTLEGQYSGQEGSGVYRVTTVWAKPKGNWQMVATHMTSIAE